MGTRHLICIVKDNNYKVAQYGQWDGYPEGQGLNILKFLKDEFIKNKFKEKLQKSVTFINDKELEYRWRNMGAIEYPRVSIKISKEFRKKYPENHRDTGSKILNIIQNTSKQLKLINDLNFAEDSSYCEWGYVIDLDKNTFEIYKGFNMKPLLKNERFYFLQKQNTGYYPIKHIVTYNLRELPFEEEFLNYFKINKVS